MRSTWWASAQAYRVWMGDAYNVLWWRIWVVPVDKHLIRGPGCCAALKDAYAYVGFLTAPRMRSFAPGGVVGVVKYGIRITAGRDTLSRGANKSPVL